MFCTYNSQLTGLWLADTVLSKGRFCSCGVDCSFQCSPDPASQSRVEQLAGFPQGQPAEKESGAASWLGSQGWLAEEESTSGKVKLHQLLQYNRLSKSLSLPQGLEIIVILPYLMVAKSWPCYVLEGWISECKKLPCIFGLILCVAGIIVVASPLSVQAKHVQTPGITHSSPLSNALLSLCRVRELCWGNSGCHLISSAEKRSSRRQIIFCPALLSKGLHY